MYKRYITLILITFFIITAMWRFSPKFEQKAAIPVKVVNMDKKDIYDSVIARGTVLEGNFKKIYTGNPVKVFNLNVSVGDSVKKGDILFEVEKSKASADQNIQNKLFDMGISTEEIITVFSEYGVEGLLREQDTEAGEMFFEPIIESPIDGVVTELNVTEGGYLTGFASAVTVSDLSDLYVNVMIPELYIGRIKKGQQAEITGDAFQNTRFYGTVDKILPIAKQTSVLSGYGETVVETVIQIDSPNESLKPGFSVTAKIITDRVNDALTIPYECIVQNEDNNELVYIVKDGRAYKAIIETGYELEDETQVLNGIDYTDLIIVNPPKELEDGVRVCTED